MPLKGQPPALVRGIVEGMAECGLLTRIRVKIPQYMPFESFVASESGKMIIPGEPVFLPRVHYAKASQSSQSSKRPVQAKTTLYGVDLNNYDKLKRLRTFLSGDKPAYTVATDEELKAVVLALPKTVQDLRAIPGFGPTKVSKYGAEILKAVEQFD